MALCFVFHGAAPIPYAQVAFLNLLHPYYCTSWYWGHCPQCIHVGKPTKTNKYHIIKNKCPGIYFLWALQDSALISYNLFWRYDEPTTFSNCSAPYMVFEHLPQETFNHGSDGVHLLLWEYFLRSGSFVFIHLMLQKKKQSLDKCQRESTWQTDCSTNGKTADWSLNAKFAVRYLRQLHI